MHFPHAHLASVASSPFCAPSFATPWFRPPAAVPAATASTAVRQHHRYDRYTFPRGWRNRRFACIRQDRHARQNRKKPSDRLVRESDN
jgi:hypothetical protein